MTIRHAKPGITGVGQIRHVGNRVEVTDWALTFCAKKCRCHQDPKTHQLSIYAGPTGQLGLRKHHACHCCMPWTVDELQEFLDQLAQISDLSTTEEQTS